MTRDALQSVLQKTYDRDRWLEMLRHVLPGTAVFASPQPVATADTGAQSIAHLARVTLDAGKRLAVLEIRVAERIDLLRNRVGLRNLIARFIDQAEFHGVLGIFLSAESDYRFTFASRVSEFDADGNLTRKETAPRRYTYILGPNESCRTAAERFAQLAAKGGTSTLADVVDAFSVEKLNKEFFADFCRAFDRVSKDIRKHHAKWSDAEVEREAQTLLDRLVFLYFVQRKGWLNRQRDHLFLHFRGQHAGKPGNSYVQQFLRPLFVKLSTEGSQADIAGHDLPFLNGGLSGGGTPPKPAGGDACPTNARDHIARLLSLDASEGLNDDERATLNASLTPDETAVLLDRLATLRACDPAVGSGAFPMGLLRELLNLARLCETRARGKDPVDGDRSWLYETKKRIIERVIYGVDIQERAIEICKLRLWLSLMVDHDLAVDPANCDARSFRKALADLEPLPNLDFKKREKITSIADFEAGSVVIDIATWFCSGADLFLTRGDARVLGLMQRIETNCRRLGELADVQRGVTPFALTDKPVHKASKPAFDGTVRRYLLDRGPKRFVRLDETLAELKPARYFTGPRILLRELISRQFRLQATYAEEDFVTNKSMQSILALSADPPLKFLLGCINSSLLSWLFLQRSNVGHRDDFPKIVLKETRELPIPNAAPEQKSQIVILVDRVLAAKRSNSSADTSALEREIDERVYQLYGLTPEEIKLVEESGK